MIGIQAFPLLAQADTNTSSNNTVGLIVVGLLFVVALVWIGVFLVRRNRLRAETQAEAAALGWRYTGPEAWQKAPGASYRVVYTYNGATRGIPWVYIYSQKSLRQETLIVGDSRRPGGRPRATTGTVQSRREDRTDWRTDAVSSPQIVFLMPKLLHPSLASLRGHGENRLISHILNLGIVEGDQEVGHRIGVDLGGMSFRLFSNPLGNLPNMDYGLKRIDSQADDIWEVYAPDETAAQAVLTAAARAALEGWKAAFQERFGANAPKYGNRHPFVLFHPDGLYLYFAEEEPNIKAVRAIVELGSQLAQTQAATTPSTPPQPDSAPLADA